MHHIVWPLSLAMFVGILAPGCQSGTQTGTRGKARTGLKTAADAGTSRRESPPDTSRPVAVYEENLEDQVTDNDFRVGLYPTVEATVFEAHIQYGGNVVRQDITVLPKSYYKRLVLKKGPTEGTCIMGFTDPDGKFNKMKLITASGTSIEVKTLKQYYLSNQ